MIAPVHRLKKDEIMWLARHKCRHSHTYLDHYNCYLTEHPDRLKIGYFDIESSNLKANFGFCIAWYILDNEGNFHGRTVSSKEVIQKDPDKPLMQELIDTLQTFDIIHTYYGTGFDLPFVRTRCVMMGLEFPFYGGLKHKDVYYIVKSKFNLSSKRLDTACEFLLGNSRKTHWSGQHWIGAVQGKKESLDYVDDHCRRDVMDLKDLSEKILDYAHPALKSI